MNRYEEFARMKKQWTAPRELTGSTPRLVRLDAGGWALAILAAALFAGAIVVAVLAGRQSAREAGQVRQLQREAVEVDARVTRVWRTSGEGKHNRAAYEFEAGGRTYRRELKVPSRVWKTLKQGGTLRVGYSPSNPEVNQPTEVPKRALSIWIAILVPAGMVAFGLLIVKAIRCSMDLLENGRPAPAVVTRVSKVSHSHGGQSTIVEYEFPLMSGGIGKGKTDWTAKGVGKGSQTCIVYDPNNPARSRRYPLQLVKVEKQ